MLPTVGPEASRITSFVLNFAYYGGFCMYRHQMSKQFGLYTGESVTLTADAGTGGSAVGPTPRAKPSRVVRWSLHDV